MGWPLWLRSSIFGSGFFIFFIYPDLYCFFTGGSDDFTRAGGGQNDAFFD
jgi:hypothetical protein